MEKKRFEQQLAFILEADKEKNILRQTHLSGHGRRENDAEHAWHMAIMIYLLREYANEPIDLAKTMMMALIHDIVEIDAGDTYAYDDTGLQTQKQREKPLPTGFLVFFRQISAGNCGHFLRNLRPTRPPKPSSPGPWTISSPFCSTIPTTAATGKPTVSPVPKS